MNIFKHIDSLRNESEPHRKRTALIVAFSFTSIIFLVWFMAVSGSSKVEYNQAQASATSSPFAAASEAFKTGSDLLGDFLSVFKESKAIIFEAASSTISNTVSGIATTTKEQ